jgi:hypothetical protein
MNLGDARERVRNATRDGLDQGTYTNYQVDWAIQYAGNEFCRKTRAVEALVTAVLAAGSAAVPSASFVSAGVLPEQLKSVYVAGKSDNILVVSPSELNQLQADYNAGGPPRRLAFLNGVTSMALWPTPDQAYTLNAYFWQLFTAWQPGDDVQEAVLNIPDSMICPVLDDGASAILAAPSAEKLLKADGWARFQAHVAACKGAGGPGIKSLRRKPAWGEGCPDDDTPGVSKRYRGTYTG